MKASRKKRGDERQSRSTQFEDLGRSFVTRYDFSARDLEQRLQQDSFGHDSNFVVPVINNNCFLNQEDLVRFVPLFHQDFNSGAQSHAEQMVYLQRLAAKVCLKTLILKEMCCRAILSYNCKESLSAEGEGEGAAKRVGLSDKLDKVLKPVAPKRNKFSRIDKAFLFKARALRRILERQERISSESNRMSLMQRTEELAGLRRERKHEFLKRKSKKSKLVSRPPQWYVEKKRRQLLQGSRARRSAASTLMSFSKRDLLNKIHTEPKRALFPPEVVRGFQAEEQERCEKATARLVKKMAKNPYAFSEEGWLHLNQRVPEPPKAESKWQSERIDSSRCLRRYSKRSKRLQGRVTSTRNRNERMRQEAACRESVSRSLKFSKLRNPEEVEKEALTRKIEAAVNTRMKRFVSMLHNSCSPEVRTFKLI